MRQNTFGGLALPRPAVELKHSSRPIAAVRSLFLKQEERERWREKRGEEKEGKGGRVIHV